MKNISNNSCMVTGHRKFSKDKQDYITQQLRSEVILAIEDGYNHFICGFAEGVDLIFANIVAELKNNVNITLKAAIPYRNRLNSKDKNFQRLLLKCDSIYINSENYSPSCFMERNKFMVQNSKRIIAVYDGRGKSGTLSTMRYANELGKEGKVIST